MSKLDELTYNDLDLIWVALREYKRKQDGINVTEANEAHRLSRLVLAARNDKPRENG